MLLVVCGPPFFEPQMERLRLVVIFSWKEHGHRESGISQWPCFISGPSMKSNLADHLQRRFVAYVPKYCDSPWEYHFILYQFLRSLIIQILLPAKPALPVCRPRWYSSRLRWFVPPPKLQPFSSMNIRNRSRNWSSESSIGTSTHPWNSNSLRCTVFIPFRGGCFLAAVSITVLHFRSFIVGYLRFFKW